jgi:hypothetical protein
VKNFGLVCGHFDAELHNELTSSSRSKTLSVSMLVREANGHYMKILVGRTEAQLRKLISIEYLALAIDLIIATEHSLDRDQVIAEAARRAEGINDFA